MQQAMAQESKLGLRLGLHIGPCLAVTLNDRLDYFGATVNQAARIEGQCKPGQLVLSNTLFQDPEVKKMFDEGFLQAEKDNVKVKGIDAPITIHRVICHPSFPTKKNIRKNIKLLLRYMEFFDTNTIYMPVSTKYVRYIKLLKL